ncbi:hypothetical protein [Methylobacterium trifolii]|uniref:Secreted protein n=1 Tax=Methylobacterium trifolii TaxID=1003092 RepID=A0ABQ4U8N7_9HYPH|nr:hypothetical protein [Methylobacterium trifolii]GJE62782.1 hypothetical protein MPOCJGCO_4918 [Methylobacterium trifolii]
MRRSAAALSALVAAALLSSLAPGAFAGGDGQGPAHAPAHVEKTFLIPSSDGYGVGDCLSTPGSECGQVVANAWCEAQGYAAAGSFGIAAPEEFTGAIDLPVSKPAERPIRVTCQD